MASLRKGPHDAWKRPEPEHSSVVTIQREMLSEMSPRDVKTTLSHWTAVRICILARRPRFVEPPRGFEPRTYALRVRSKHREIGGNCLFSRDLLSLRMMAFQGLTP
jgi:hypothetical protein